MLPIGCSVAVYKGFTQHGPQAVQSGMCFTSKPWRLLGHWLAFGVTAQASSAHTSASDHIQEACQGQTTELLVPARLMLSLRQVSKSCSLCTLPHFYAAHVVGA
mmetsp:Transcript_12964/g.35884  ORF Transcript_12964/g.35884 Transcript_12964/m.35884 type:complete len:104 (-) Transcript_12964:4037-4348(-)